MIGVTQRVGRVTIDTTSGVSRAAPTEALNAIVRNHPRIDGHSPTSRLLLACPDQPGLIAAVSGFLADAGRNIVDADQHSSDEGRFFMRMAFDQAPEGEREELYRRFEDEVAAPLRIDHRFAESDQRRRVAIMVSREDHCLSDLLWRWRSGELGGELVRKSVV